MVHTNDPTPTAPVMDPHEYNIIRSPCLYGVFLVNVKYTIDLMTNVVSPIMDDGKYQDTKQILQTEGLAPNLGEIFVYAHRSFIPGSSRSGVQLVGKLGNGNRRPPPLPIKRLTVRSSLDSGPVEICQLLDLSALKTLELNWPPNEQRIELSEKLRLPSLTTLVVDLSLLARGRSNHSQVKLFIRAHPSIKQLQVRV